MGKWDGYHDIDQDDDEDMEYYADVHGYEDDEPEPVELTDAEVIARLKDELDAANARIAELETEIKVIPFDFIRVACDVARNNGYAFDSVWAWLKKYGKDEPQ